MVNNKEIKVTTNCVDIARIINQYKPKDNIVVKIDVEGAEYELLQDFIKKDAMKLIDYMVVEFHTYVSPFKTPEDLFISLIKNQGINFINWS